MNSQSHEIHKLFYHKIHELFYNIHNFKQVSVFWYKEYSVYVQAIKCLRDRSIFNGKKKLPSLFYHNKY